MNSIALIGSLPKAVMPNSFKAILLGDYRKAG